MNKQCYRVVFNKARGMMMVVSEAAKSQTKTTGNGNRKTCPTGKSGNQSSQSISYSRLAIAILCCQSMIYTQVQAATSAIQNTASNIPVDQRAALLRAPNGAPIVNIRTPNSNGLSHNTYNQFDIGSNGAVLNNSIGGANTQLAGAITGNQYLALGAANTILNEVRSNAPTKFQGNLEVAGQRADIVIASPSGLQIQGGGFINANRATLTTGTPKIDSAGNLTGFDVKQGQIAFDNATTGNSLGGDLYDGKNKNQANYVDVLARAVSINGQIHANQDVDIVIGSNSVDYDTGAATKITGTGVVPTLAVDVSALGGIYANSINLIGTDSGLGVRNAGNIKATQQIVLTNSGKIENTGVIETTKAQTSLVSIDATGTTGSVTHSGTISSYGMIDIQADKDITIDAGIVKKNSAGTAIQLMPDIIRIDAGGSLKVSNSSDVRNFTVDDQTNIYTHSTLDTTVDSKSAIASNGGVSIDADRYARVLDTGSISAGVGTLNITSKSGTTVDNATVTGRGDVYINSRTADTIVSNNSQLSAQKSLAIGAGRDATFKSGSKVVAASNLTIAATRNATIDTASSIKVTNDATMTAGELAYLKDSIQPITIGKQLTIEGKQATVSNSTANAADGIYITSQGKATTITNSTLNSTKGSVTAIANQAALNTNNLTTNSNSTILAAGSNVGITTSKFNSDNIVVESGATTSISGLTTAAKDSKQVGGTSITSKENTSIINSTLNSTGNTVMRSDKTLTLTNNDIQSQGIVLKTNTANTLKDAGGLDNSYGDGDINISNTKLSATSSANIGLIIDAANYLGVGDSNVVSANNTTLKSGNTLKLNNSQINAGKNLAIDSSERFITNGDLLPGYADIFAPSPVRANNIYHGFSSGTTTLQAGEILSIDSASTQSYRNTDITGGAALINSDSNINFDNGVKITVADNYKLAANTELLNNGKAVSTLNGDLVINSRDDLTIDPKKLIIANNYPSIFWFGGQLSDVTLSSNNGKLYLKGYEGTKGLGSEQIVKIMASGDINLSGKEVIVEGSDLSSTRIAVDYNNLNPFGFGTPTTLTPSNGINITATDGSVELKGVKNSFTNTISQYKINSINSEIANAQAELNQSFSDTLWAEEFNKQKLDWVMFVFNDCRKSPFRSSSECRQKRINDMGIAERSRPNYFKMTKSLNYEDYMSYLSRQETLRDTLSDLNQVVATSQKASTGFEHKASSIVAGKDINIIAKQGVLIEGADISSSIGGINILAEGNLAATSIEKGGEKVLGLNGARFEDAVAQGWGNIALTKVNGVYKSAQQLIDAGYDAVGAGGVLLKDIEPVEYIFKDSIRITGLADIYQQGNMSNGTVTGPNYSYHQLVNQPKLTAKGDIKISAQGKLAKATDAYNSVSKTYTTNNAVILNSADIISTGGNVRIDAALGDINLEASQAAFMDGSQTTTTKRKWYGKKKTTTTTKTSNNANAVTTDIQANNISLIAENNINIYGSELTAVPTGSINISAGKLLNLYAVDDVNESSVDVKKKSSFLGVRYNKDHTNDTRQELSQLPAKLIGGKAYTASGGSTLLEGTVFKTLKPADIKVGVGKYADDTAQVILAPITNQISTTHKQEKESTVWMKTVEERDTVTTAQLPKFNQTPTITSPKGVVIGVPIDVDISDNNEAKLKLQTSQKELGKIALNLSKQPGYEYLAELDKKNEINWVQVQLIQEHFEFEQEGLTPAAAALIAIAVSMATGGTGGAYGATLFGTTSVAGSAAANAAFASLASQASVSLINNKGDIGKTFKDLASSSTLRSTLTAALTAGIGESLNSSVLQNFNSDGFGDSIVRGMIQSTSDAAISSAISGTSFEDSLKFNLINTFTDIAATQISTQIGSFDFSDNEFVDGLSRSIAQGVAGCVAGQIASKDCSSRAMGAALGEAIGTYMASSKRQYIVNENNEVISFVPDVDKQFILNITKLITASTAALYGLDVNDAAQGSQIAVENNALGLKFDKYTGKPTKEDVLSSFQIIFKVNDKGHHILCFGNTAECLPRPNERYATNAEAQKGLQEFALAVVPIPGGAGFRVVAKKTGEVLGTYKDVKAAQQALKTWCFVAGTLVETIDGLKAIETIKQGDLIWSRHEETLEYGYRPVVNTVSFDDKEIYEVVVEDNDGKLETYQTTEEHPFWVVDTGWLPASLLQIGMTLVNRDDKAVLTVVSQSKLDKTDTVYNFEVEEFHTYHIGEFGTWVHNSCIEKVLPSVKSFEQARNKAFDLIEEVAPMGSSKPVIGRLKTSKGYGQVVGRESLDGKVRWRLDYDDSKGMHINVEDFRLGKGDKAKKYAIPIEGGKEADFTNYLKQFNR